MLTMLQTTVSGWIGQRRKIALEKVFDQPDRFESVDAAYNWCRAEGFSVGAMESGSPRGLKRGDWQIEKWPNLDRDDLTKFDGLEGS
jgi:hypothetical protein